MSKPRVLTPEIERKAPPHRPKDSTTAGGSWIIETGGAGSGGTPTIPGAPPVTIAGPPNPVIIFRQNHQVEVDVAWNPAATATKSNFTGVAVYLEDPDISSGGQVPLDGSMALPDVGANTNQSSGQWAPIFVNNCYKSPAVVIVDSTMGSTPNASYTGSRKVRIYLAAFGPNTSPQLVRANVASPTPNVLAEIDQGPGQGESGMEYAFLVTNPAVAVATDYNRPDPQYTLTFSYTPPDPNIPIPKGMNNFAGVRIIFVPDNSAFTAPQFTNLTNTGLNVPVNQSSGYKSPVYSASAGGSYFRVYFCSEDNSQPLGSHINTLVDGVTPMVQVTVPPVPPAPDVTSFTINGGATLSLANTKFVWQLDNTFEAQATLAWSLPTAAAGGARYAGVYLYLVNVTGSVQPLTKFPQLLTGQQSNVDTGFPLNISNIPANVETWTIAAISVSNSGVLADNPASLQHSPTVQWTIGPPPPYSQGSGQEYAPWVTINAGAKATPTEAMSADGVQTVSFNVGSWTDPTDNRFGSAEVAMVLNGQIGQPVYWAVPGNATSFTTPAVPSFGNIGQPVTVDFYIVSGDGQGNFNSLNTSTPKISTTYTPTAGQVVSKRAGNFNTNQFQWSDPSGGFSAWQISAQIVQVGSTVIVGGNTTGTFGGLANGQIAVYNNTPSLIGWIGQQNPGAANAGSSLYGAWFKQLWVGGNDPLTAPIFIDQQGIIEVGGVAAQHGYAYPYISIRSNTGLEVGRIGSQIAKQTGLSGDNTGGTPPPQLTDGAWFTQLAVGGSSLSNWNMLIIPHQATPPTFGASAGGSDFYMRNVYLMSIDYPANASPSGSNPEYKIDFGNSVWMAAGLNGGFKFPGIHMYEVDGPVDGTHNNFGSTFINRGMVLRGPSGQNYNVLASLVMWNGDTNGGDGTPFWGELDLYSPAAGNPRTVLLASGNAGNSNGQLLLQDVNGNTLFRAGVDGTIVNKWGTVIGADGTWQGVAIPSTGQPQTPWASDIQGGNHNLSQVNSISCASITTTGAALIGTSVTCASVNATNGYSGGSFTGAGVAVGGQGVSCGYLQINNTAPGNGNLSVANNVSCASLTVTGSFSPSTLTLTGAQGSWQLQAGGGLWLTCSSSNIASLSAGAYESGNTWVAATAVNGIYQINGNQHYWFGNSAGGSPFALMHLDGNGNLLIRGTIQQNANPSGLEARSPTDYFTGSFTIPDGRTVTITNGMITRVE